MPLVELIVDAMSVVVHQPLHKYEEYFEHLLLEVAIRTKSLVVLDISPVCSTFTCKMSRIKMLQGFQEKGIFKTFGEPNYPLQISLAKTMIHDKSEVGTDIDRQSLLDKIGIFMITNIS